MTWWCCLSLTASWQGLATSALRVNLQEKPVLMHASVSAPTGLECLTREWMVWRHTQLQHKGLLVLLCHPHPRPHPLLPPLPHLTDCHRHRLTPQSRSQTSSQSCGSCRKMLPLLCGGKHVSCSGVSAVCIWALQISTYFPQAQAGGCHATNARHGISRVRSIVDGLPRMGALALLPARLWAWT